MKVDLIDIERWPDEYTPPWAQAKLMQKDFDKSEFELFWYPDEAVQVIREQIEAFIGDEAYKLLHFFVKRVHDDEEDIDVIVEAWGSNWLLVYPSSYVFKIPVE